MRISFVAAAPLLIACGGSAGKSENSRPVTQPRSETGSENPPAVLGAQGAIPLTTLAGKGAELRDYGAPVTVIAVWATWCAPCLEELPYVEALYREYRDDRQVSVLAVNVDEPELRERVHGVIEDLGLTLPVLVDGQPLLKRLVAGSSIGLPLLAVIDPIFQIHRRTGFKIGISEEQYLEDKRALIRAALRRQAPSTAAVTQ